jgi:hypothetical protein
MTPNRSMCAGDIIIRHKYDDAISPQAHKHILSYFNAMHQLNLINTPLIIDLKQFREFYNNIKKAKLLDNVIISINRSGSLIEVSLRAGNIEYLSKLSFESIDTRMPRIAFDTWGSIYGNDYACVGHYVLPQEFITYLFDTKYEVAPYRIDTDPENSKLLYLITHYEHVLDDTYFFISKNMLIKEMTKCVYGVDMGIFIKLPLLERRKDDRYFVRLYTINEGYEIATDFTTILLSNTIIT